MLVTPDGMVTEVSAVPKKAALPIDVTLCGMVIDCSLVALLKTAVPMLVRPSWIVTEVIGADANTLVPMLLTVEGMFIEVNSLYWKACLPILVRPSWMVMEANFELVNA